MGDPTATGSESSVPAPEGSPSPGTGRPGISRLGITKPGRTKTGWPRPGATTDFADFVVVKVFVDVLAALHQERMSGNVFAFDANRPYGSAGQGTDQIATVVRRGDQLLWVPLSLECEAFVDIVDVAIPGLAAKQVPVLGAACWTARPPVPTDPIRYRLTFELGHLGRQLELDTFALVAPPTPNSPAVAQAHSDEPGQSERQHP